MKYLDGSIKDYLNDLAAKKPAPGGGSAAALAAAIGVSLMSMVINYTIGKKECQDGEEKCKSILDKVVGFRNKLQDLIDEDVEAYNQLYKGVKEYGKDSPQLEPIYQEATNVPFAICRICAEGLNLCKELAEYGNKNLVTDTAIAAILLEGAFFSGKFNVYINLKFIKDMEYIAKLHQELQPLEETMPKLKEEILHKCEEVIAK